MTTAIYPAATARDGMGHVVRCAALATALADRGVDVEVWLEGPAAIEPVVRAEGIVPQPLPGNSLEAALEIRTPETLVVDRPSMPGEFLADLPGETTVVAFDDRGERSLPVDLVVNPTVFAEELAYPAATDVLRGPAYLPLRRQFRNVSPATDADTPSVLVALGGGNPGGHLDRVVGHVREQTDGPVDVLVGPLADAVTDHPGVTYHRSPEDVAAHMAAATFAVCGGGLTLAELVACGTPPVAITFDALHERTIGGFTVRNACLPVGSPGTADFESTLVDAVRRLYTDPHRRTQMADAGRDLVDVRGGDRLAEAVASR